MVNNNATWFVGFVGTWFVLSAMAESRSLYSLANALAISVAITATFVMGGDAAKNLGVS